MQTVQLDSVSLAYDESGSGPDTVFVHGIPTDLRAWDAQKVPFSKNYRVVTYSRRHAKPNDNQGPPSESTIEKNAQDLEQLIRKTTSPPINLVGHSYGGFIAGYLAADHPALVKRLVLIEPGISTLLVQNQKSRAQMISLLFRSPSVALAAGSYLRQYYNPMLKAYRDGNLDTALRLFLDGLMNRTNAFDQLPDNIQNMLKENASTIGEVEAEVPIFTKNDASRITAPTLLINGSNGTKVFRAINQRLARSIPNAQLVLIAGSSHFPHFENSGEFNQRVLEFLG